MGFNVKNLEAHKSARQKILNPQIQTPNSKKPKKMPTINNHYLSSLKIRGQTYQLPIYLPDATLGVVRGLDSVTLKQLGIEGVVINTYHLKDHPGVDILEQAGGIKALMNFTGLTASDSGGFQLFSLIQKNPDMGKIIDEGLLSYTGIKKQKRVLFTPEDSIKTQFAINSDIMICFDDFSPDDAKEDRLEESVRRTIAWAGRCKLEFEKQLALHQYSGDNRPLLLAVIQGHRSQYWRKYCADALLEIGFDGYGLGGWPFIETGKFDYDMCQFNASLTPDDKPRFALGIGSPENIAKLWQMGYHIFDCVLPTRDARHQRLYNFTTLPTEITFEELGKENHPWYEFIYLNKAKYATDFKAIGQFCDCFTCQNYTSAYLHHLFKVKDTLAYRLATIHNLQFYAELIEVLRILH